MVTLEWKVTDFSILNKRLLVNSCGWISTKSTRHEKEETVQVQ